MYMRGWAIPFATEATSGKSAATRDRNALLVASSGGLGAPPSR